MTPSLTPEEMAEIRREFGPHYLCTKHYHWLDESEVKIVGAIAYGSCGYAVERIDPRPPLARALACLEAAQTQREALKEIAQAEPADVGDYARCGECQRLIDIAHGALKGETGD